MKKCLCEDWIKSYLKYVRNTEQPRSYHLWNAICCIAGALQRRVWMPWGSQDIIFPNLYVVLVGRSGLGKGRSMRPAIALFRETGLPLAPDAVTIEKLVVLIEEKRNQFVDRISKIPINHMSVSLYSQELSVLLGKKDMVKLSILTDLYDCQEMWDKATKGSGTENLENVCLNIIGASAPDWFSSMFPQEAIGGGFTSRIIFVVEKVKYQIIARPTHTDEQRNLWKDLVHDLRIIASPEFNGPMVFDDACWDFWEKYYIEENLAMQRDEWPVKDRIFRGYCERRSLHLRKISMAFAVSRHDFNWKVEVRDFKKAQKVLFNAEKKMPHIFSGIGINVYAHVTSAIMQYMEARGVVTKKEILRNFSNEIDGVSIKIIEQTLEDMGFMKIMVNPKDRQVVYVPLESKEQEEDENPNLEE